MLAGWLSNDSLHSDADDIQIPQNSTIYLIHIQTIKRPELYTFPLINSQ